MTTGERQVHYKQIFPNLENISERIIPGSNSQRPTIESYRESLKLQERLTPAVEESLEKAAEIRSNTKAIVYIAGPLTGVADELKHRYEDVSKLLATYGDGTFFGYAPHVHGTDPVKHPHVTPGEVRDIDNLWASVVADFHVNFLYPTGHGNAIEEGWAEKTLIPTVYANEEGHRLSRLVLGMNNVSFAVNYRDFGMDGYEQMPAFFDELATWLETFPERDPREFYYMSYDFLAKPVAVESEKTGNEVVIPMEDVLVYDKSIQSPAYRNVGKLQWVLGDSVSYELETGELWQANPSQVSIWLK